MVEFLKNQLQIPPFKAEELARRVEKQYFKVTINNTKRNTSVNLGKNEDTRVQSQGEQYSVENLSEKEFDRFLTWLFAELAYQIDQKTAVTQSGFNLVATKDGEKVFIQARRCPIDSFVTDEEVSIAKKEKLVHNCEKSILLASSYFTEQAIAQAQEANIELWDKDALDKKINNVRACEMVDMQAKKPEYQGSLLQSLLRLEETDDFFIQPRAGGKYDVHLPGVKFPLLTFQTESGKVTACVRRIRNNEPIGEFEGTDFFGRDKSNSIDPEDQETFKLIVKYLESFLK